MSNEHMKTSLRSETRWTVDGPAASCGILTVPLSTSVNVNSTPTEARLRPSERYHRTLTQALTLKRYGGIRQRDSSRHPPCTALNSTSHPLYTHL